MDIEYIRQYCLNKKHTTEETPFDHYTLVFKVWGKMFCLFNMDTFESMNLKCEPHKSLELREKYQGIKPGYHMHKKHWITVSFNADVPKSLLLQLIDNSYQRVIETLPKKTQKNLEE